MGVINRLYTSDTSNINVFLTVVIPMTHKPFKMLNYQQDLGIGNYFVINVAWYKF